MVTGIRVVKHGDDESTLQRAGAGDARHVAGSIYSIVWRAFEICPRYCQRVPTVSGK